MRKGIKVTLIVVLVLVTLVVIGGYVTLRILGEAFGAECEKSKSWTIAEYKIQEYKCLGWAGPHYYPADLFKNGKRIDESKFIRDSCFLVFRPEDNLYLKFNVCNETIREIRASKHKLDIGKVNSVYIKDIQRGATKTLGDEAIKKFINDWNKSKISDYRERDPIFSPDIGFEILVSLENDEIKFYGFNYLIADEFNWVYYIDESDTAYFDNLMNKKYR